MCGLNWAWVSGLFAGYGLGPNWAPASKPSWAPRRILRGCVGNTGLVFLGCLLGMEWAPIGPQLASLVGPHFGYGIDTWVKLNLGFWADCWVVIEWVPIGPQPTSPVGPHVGYCLPWMCGLN